MVDGFNLYQYGRSNPVRYRDPNGTRSNEEIELIAKGKYTGSESQDRIREEYGKKGIEYHGEAMWNEPGKLWVVDRSQLVDPNSGEPSVDTGAEDQKDSAQNEDQRDPSMLAAGAISPNVQIGRDVHGAIEEAYRAANLTQSSKIFTDRWLSTIVKNTPGGKLSGLGSDWRKRPDIVNMASASIYEIKPNNPIEVSSGRVQVREYQAALGRANVPVNLGGGAPGTSGIVTVGKKSYSYHLAEAGLIVYEPLPDLEPKEVPLPLPVPETSKEPKPMEVNWNTVATVGLVTLAVVGAVLLFSGGAAAPALALAL